MHAISRQTTEEVREKLLEWICRYGIPTCIHLDHGTCLTSRAFEEFCSRYAVKHAMSTPYHPQGNGSVERLNRSLGEMLSKLVASNQLDWQKHLPEIQFAHNTTFHESIATTPYKVVFKEDPRTIIHAAADVIYRPPICRNKRKPIRSCDG